MLSKEMSNWLQEQEEDDVDGYLDVDLYIKGWIEKVKRLEEGIQKAMNNIGVPQKGYPANIATAYQILDVVLEDDSG